MNDLISRQAVINMKCLLEDWTGKVCEGVLVEDIERLPSVEPKKGKWKVTPMYIKCSECGESFMLIPQNFCPNCGTDMRGEE